MKPRLQAEACSTKSVFKGAVSTTDGLRKSFRILLRSLPTARSPRHAIKWILSRHPPFVLERLKPEMAGGRQT
jgi:hypothetical protein